jgi:fatty-acyl-CoA synthase
MPAANAAALLRANAHDPDRRDRPAIRFEDRVWTHGEYFAESCRWGHLLLDRREPNDRRPFHVALLLDNIPEYLFALGAAALVGATVVGLNHTRQGEALLRDIRHTDCGILVYEPRHQGLIEPILNATGIDPDHVLVVGQTLEPALAGSGTDDVGSDLHQRHLGRAQSRHL